MSIFTSLEALFSKLDSEAAQTLEGRDMKPLAEPLQKLLFQHDVNAYMESIRLQRAKALLALSTTPLTTLVREVISADAVAAEIAKEPASVVQDVLRKVPGS